MVFSFWGLLCFCMFWILTLCQMYSCEDFVNCVGSFFTWMMVPLLYRISLVTWGPICQLLVWVLLKSCPVPLSSDVCPDFYLDRLRVSCHILSLYTDWGKRRPDFILPCVVRCSLVCSAPFVEDNVFSPMYAFSHFVDNHVAIGAQAFVGYLQFYSTMWCLSCHIVPMLFLLL